MALHLNLYHEIHTAAHQRARDPAKLAMIGGIAVVLLLIGYYFLRLNEVETLKAEADSMSAEWRKLEPAMKKAETEAVTFTERAKSNALLIGRIDGRFYWAGFLDLLNASIPTHIQIASLKGGELKGAAGKWEIFLQGVAAGEQPRTTAESFRVALQEALGKQYRDVNAEFEANSLEETPDEVALEGKALNTARFHIRLTLDGRPPAPPEPEKKKKP